MNDEGLEGLVGKGIAERLMSAEPEKNAYTIRVNEPSRYDVEGRVSHDVLTPEGSVHARAFDAAEAERIRADAEAKTGNVRKVKGDDLALGGEGHLEFYDRVLPRVLAKYLKTLGPGFDALIEKVDMGGKMGVVQSLRITDALVKRIRRGQRLGAATVEGAAVGAIAAGAAATAAAKLFPRGEKEREAPKTGAPPRSGIAGRIGR